MSGSDEENKELYACSYLNRNRQVRIEKDLRGEVGGSWGNRDLSLTSGKLCQLLHKQYRITLTSESKGLI